jgi:Protein of unknown function (DUF3048) N-terminal domain/Protein of unknown function (DUF3048) C-terminal domain
LTYRRTPTKTDRRRIARVGALTLIGALLLAACTDKVKPPVPSPPKLSAAAPTTSARPTPNPSPTPTPAAVNPLTGLAPVPTGSVVAVKIDDTSHGRPQKGVDLADIVYIEQAEGGVSRLVAVFATNKPVVEPVRSVRTSDPELLSQYGAITLVASGGGGQSLPTLKASVLKYMIDDFGDKGFARDNNRDAPYNLQSNLVTVTTDQPNGNPAQSIGFTWSATVPTGTPGSTIATKVGGTDVNFSWDAPTGKYVRVINGVRQKAADGNLIATPNVIVQFVSVTPDPTDIDVDGHESQYTHSIGTGPVSVFRNGQRIDGTWTRTSLSTGTTLTSAAGTPIALAPGGTWVLLVSTGTALTAS